MLLEPLKVGHFGFHYSCIKGLFYCVYVCVGVCMCVMLLLRVVIPLLLSVLGLNCTVMRLCLNITTST